MHIFPYSFLQFDGVIIPYPIVTALLPLRLGWQVEEFVVDSGADNITFPKQYKYLLNINPKDCQKGECQGIGKQNVATLETEIEIGFCGKKFKVPVVITDNKNTPLLLGKLGIWDKFNVNFNNKKKRVEFVEI